MIADWRKAAPQSRAAALTEAIYWLQYAHNARGSGYANSVTSDGWKLFRERLEKAENVLIESKPYAESSPLWGRLYIEIATGLDWPKDKVIALFRSEAEREGDYVQLYTATTFSLSPRWGGSWELVDDFIGDAAKTKRDKAGAEFYTRLYVFIADTYGTDLDLFKDTKANWPEMKRGFEDMMRNYPHSGTNLNLYAAYACMADDGDTFTLLRLRLGAQVDPSRYPANHSLDLCDHKFGKKRI